MRWVTFVTQMLLLLNYANADVYDALEAIHSDAGSQPCTKDNFAAQIPVLTGSWVNSTDDTFNGFYTMSEDCPSWARDYDCKNPTQTGEAWTTSRRCEVLQGPLQVVLS
jgi:hypothetical protein